MLRIHGPGTRSRSSADRRRRPEGGGRPARRGRLPRLRPRPPALLLRHHRHGQPGRPRDLRRRPARAAEVVVLDGIPQGFIHDGGRLAFGPDGFLYVSTGETGDPAWPRTATRSGARSCGSRPTATPPRQPVPGLADLELRPPQRAGAGVRRRRDRLWASEFGQNTFDELNLIEAGDNYGWPLVEGRGGRGGLVDPQVVWATDVASPSGLAFLDGAAVARLAAGPAAVADRRHRAAGPATRRTSSSAPTGGCAPWRWRRTAGCG